MRDFFRKFFNISLTDADIKYMLWKSAERLRRSKAGVIEQAQDVVTERGMREEVARMSREEADYQREIREITERAKADGTFMKAPNGKPSNLDARQWAHVRSSRFKKWFGDWELAQLYTQALRAWDSKESKDKTIIGLHGKAAQRLADLLGHDVNLLVITDDAIRHIKKQHSDATSEHARGQAALTPEDIVTIPYIINNFDTMELAPAQDDSMGNKAVEVRKRVNGVSVVGTIERGKDKLFVVTSWRMEKSDALDASTTPGPNVRNDSDMANVKKEIESIKGKAKDCSKVVDENGEPLVVYHGTDTEFTVFDRPLNMPRIFTSSSRDFAEGYGRPMPLFLNMRNPLTFDFDGKEAFEPLEVNGTRLDDIEELAVYAGMNGYDGVIAKNVRDRGTHTSSIRTNDEYIVVEPRQLKSAADNVGTYDASNNDIRFAIGRKRKEDMRKGLMSKLANAGKEDVERTIAEIEKLGEQSKAGGDARVEKAALHWAKAGTIILPEDGDKVLRAVKLAGDKGIDFTQ